MDISDIQSVEELIEKIKNSERDEDKYYEYVLIGNRNIEIITNDIIKQIEDKKVIKIKDESKIQYNLEEIAKESTLKGIFVRELLNQIEEDESNKEEKMRIIEIGLNAM